MSLLLVGVQAAKQIITELVKKSNQLVTVGFWLLQVVPWEQELRIRFAQISENGSELVGFSMETRLWVQRVPRSSLSPDLDKFSLHNVFCMKDVVRMSGKSKQNVQPSTNANRRAAECRTSRILPDNALQLT